MMDIDYFSAPNGERLAHRFLAGGGPALVFLPGYMSDMTGSKAQAVLDQLNWQEEPRYALAG